MGNRVRFEKTKNQTIVELAEYTYNASNQMLRETSYNVKKHSIITYRYDKDGNRVAETGMLGSKKVDRSYLYSVENRLKAVYNGKELLMAAAYDGDGNRIFQLNYNRKDEYGSQNRSGILFPLPQKAGELERELMELVQMPEYGNNYELMEYVNDINRQHTEVLMERNINGDLESAYSYGLNRLSRDWVTNEVSYYHYDPRGSVTGVTDQNAVLWHTYRYEPFGNISFGKPQHTNVYAYNGESYNPNTQSQFLRGRFYDTVLGNFYSEDRYLGNVFDPLSLNRYNYSKSNPLHYKDPSGHMLLPLTMLSGAMLQTVNPPRGVASELTIARTMNITPRAGSILNLPPGESRLQELAREISSLTNQYVGEANRQERENTLKEIIDQVETMSTMLCGEPKEKTKVLTDYRTDLLRLLGYYKGPGNITKQQLEQMIKPYSDGGISLNAKVEDLDTINDILKKYGFDTPEKMKHFFAQVAHESKVGPIEKYNGNSPEEYFAERDFRTEYGNNAKGDGSKYRGAGYIQLTWKSTYQAFANYVGDQDIVNKGAAYVAENYAWEAAGWFWQEYKGINTLIDNGATVKDVTKKVNGGSNGLDERISFYDRLGTIIK